jgi:hypothetical protein
MPPWVLAVELAVVRFHVLALFDGALAIGNGNALQPQVVRGKQGALAAKSLVFNRFHIGYILFS